MGATAVEFALTFPLLMSIVFTSYELTRANMIRHTTEAAAYEGARTGIIPGASNQTVEESVRRVLSSVNVRNFTVNISPALSPTVEEVTVTIDVPFGSNFSFAFFLGNSTLTRSCTLTREEARIE